MFDFFKKLFWNNACENCDTTETITTEEITTIEPTLTNTATEEVIPEITSEVTSTVTENTEVIEPIKQAETTEPIESVI